VKIARRVEEKSRVEEERRVGLPAGGASAATEHFTCRLLAADCRLGGRVGLVAATKAWPKKEEADG
jgi:hypothetical protein